MLGWHISVFRQVDGGTSPAREGAEEGARLAVWQADVGGLRWLDALVEAGQAVNLGGNGYPSYYTAQAEYLIPRIVDGPPAARDTRMRDPQEVVRLGDGWWELAENEESGSLQQPRLHAVDCYRRAQRDVSGLTREKLGKRIDEVVSTSHGVPLGSGAPIQLVPQQSFSIRAERRLPYRVRVPKIESGKGVLAIGVAHMGDGTGVDGMYVNLINYNGRIVMRRFGKGTGWLWFGQRL